jgi:ankyrin repeat and BTB/POZ domain-containing protein 1
MFDSEFREAQDTPHLQIVLVDCSPEVLEIILTFLYTEKAEFGLELAVDVLFAADMLFLEKVKAKAAVIISTLGNGIATSMATEVAREDEYLNIYEILRAAWFTRVQRLEEFAARYISYRLESYIDEPEFAEVVKESASRISARQETDSIELLDDIRYYLGERFRLRFEHVGLDEEEERALAEAQEQSQHEAITNGTIEKPLPDWGSEKPVQEDEGVDVSTPEVLIQAGAVRTLDGEIAADEFAADAVNYQILLGKIDTLLEKLELDA